MPGTSNRDTAALVCRLLKRGIYSVLLLAADATQDRLAWMVKPLMVKPMPVKLAHGTLLNLLVKALVVAEVAGVR